MQEIDFLPAEYRQNHARRQSQPWRIVVVAAFGAMVVAAAVGQHHFRGRIEADLAAVMPAHEAAVAQNASLSELQSQLQEARADAELYTYLCYPWPRTQIIDALLTPLPDEITFQQLDIQNHDPPDRPPVERLSGSQRDAEADKLTSMPAAARDLQRLRDERDIKRTVVTLTGVTSESTALHSYLGELGQDGLFSDVDFSFESDEVSDNGSLRFTATLTVRPGYGQQHGPTGEEPEAPEKIEPIGPGRIAPRLDGDVPTTT